MGRFGTLMLAAITLVPLATPAAAAQKDEPAVIGVAKSDPEMNAAIAKGRASFPAFLERLANPAPDEREFYVKFNLVPQGNAEYIWANDLKREGPRLTGMLTNVPMAKGFARGQRVTIDPARVIDWSYYKGNVVQGNVTTRVLLSRFPAEQAAAIKAEYGW